MRYTSRGRIGGVINIQMMVVGIENKLCNERGGEKTIFTSEVYFFHKFQHLEDVQEDSR